ncbi:MAG: hypothetical protein HC771_03250 [Synechococcales cyanobacterium CRU_2_2]|nr:hypothetical protein [Synechococcales cyanobacterium CRU_2_2]
MDRFWRFSGGVFDGLHRSGGVAVGGVEAQLAARSQPSMTGAPAVSGATAGDADISPAIAQPLWMQLAVQGAGIGALMLTAQALITLTLTRTIAAPLVRLKQAAQMLSRGSRRCRSKLIRQMRWGAWRSLSIKCQPTSMPPPTVWNNW